MSSIALTSGTLLLGETYSKILLESGDAPRPPEPRARIKTRSIVLTDADGTAWDLCDGDVRLGVDPDLWGAAPARVAFRDRINLPGSDPIGARHAARDIVLPVTFLADDPAGLDALIRRFVSGCDPLRGQVTLEVANGRDDVSRRIDGFALDGLDSITVEDAESLEAEAVIALKCPHPYWRDSVPQVVTVKPPLTVWEAGIPSAYNAPMSYNSPLPYNGVQFGDIAYNAPISYNDPVPYNGTGSSAVILDLTNMGDVAAWPVFTVVGPCTRVSAANLTTGQSWRLSEDLTASDRLVVTTTPGAATARINGALALGRLDDGADLWGLPARSTCRVALEFAGRSASSSFLIEFTPEWLRC